MKEQKPFVHPYIPNAVPAVKQQMLREVGASDIEEFYEDIPEHLRLKQPMNLPDPLLSEFALRKHVEDLLSRNTACNELLNFRGAGCWQHYVPSICDEINSRSEFLTAYAGEPYDDHGRFQALFEYESMMGELLEMDVVNVPTYDGFQAAATSCRMAARLTGRHEIVLCGSFDPGKLAMMRQYCQPDLTLKPLAASTTSGQLDLEALGRIVTDQTAAVFFENPSFLGTLEPQSAAIADLAHRAGALCVVGVDPISLGVLEPPINYGADIVCGDLQPLGMHMQFGGGQAGFIATRDDPRYVMEFPSRLFGIGPTRVPGEYGFGDVAYERTSFAVREQGKEWVGTASALWGITAGVYLALMGPQGMQEIGEQIMLRSHYAARQIDRLEGARAPYLAAPFFKEFVVNFDATGRTVAEVNQALLQNGIVGGKDLSTDFPALGQSALYSVTEVHTQHDIDTLVAALGEAIQ